MFAHLKKTSKPTPGRRWGDNDDDEYTNNQSKSHQFVNEANQAYRPAYFGPNQPQSQTHPQSNRNQSLIEDYLQSKGISFKPNDELVNYFKTRPDNEREKIINALMVRVSNYKSYVENQDNVRMLTRCLFLIECFSMNQVQDFNEAFEERLDLFESIMECYPTNKKISEICNSLITLYSSSNIGCNRDAQVEQMQSNANTNLLELDQETNEGNLLIMGNDTPQQIGANVNLLKGIFSEGPQKLHQQQEQQQQQSAPISIKVNSGFDVIPSHQGKDVDDVFSLSQLPPQKKTFNFIKSKSPTITSKAPGIESELNDIFASSSSSSNQFGNGNMPSITLLNTNHNSSPIEKQIQYNPPHEIKEGPKFNYDHVYNNANGLKRESEEEKDPFNFVNAILKPKK